MKTAWTDWAKKYLLPFPGDAWTVDADLKAAANKVGEVTDDVGTEVSRAVKLRVNEHYNEEGNHPKDTFGRDLVDLWVAKKGVVFAMEVVLVVCRTRQVPRNGYPGGRDYEIRIDAQPWARLREHLFAASPADRDAAIALAENAFPADGFAAEVDHFAYGLAFVTCKQDWVSAGLPFLVDKGYGTLALLAATTDVAALRTTLDALLSEAPAYMIVENGWAFLPNVLVTLEDSDAELVGRLLAQPWNRATKKPYVELARCLSIPAANKLVAEADGVAVTLVKKPTKKPTKKAAKTTKKTAKKTAKKK